LLFFVQQWLRMPRPVSSVRNFEKRPLLAERNVRRPTCELCQAKNLSFNKSFGICNSNLLAFLFRHIVVLNRGDHIEEKLSHLVFPAFVFYASNRNNDGKHESNNQRNCPIQH
jgi:hypothetical protein